MRTIIGMLSLFVVAGSASAACGGGGYRARTDVKPGLQPTKSESSTYEVRSAPASKPVVLAPGAFDARFDTTSAKLNLSTRQSKDVSDGRNDVQRQLANLQDKRQSAQAKLDHCTGNCDKETRKLAEATANLNNFDAALAFDAKLNHILNNAQMVTYRSTK